MLGVYGLTGRYLFPPADKLDEAEQAAMVAAVKAELVVPQDPTTTVKINIAWTENVRLILDTHINTLFIAYVHVHVCTHTVHVLCVVCVCVCLSLSLSVCLYI